ncbi:MCE family protein [Mycobacterium sp. 236(2023)]|uniref:MCE family protein n=1 Tax=Mycobacterium sp. 236(2023) TaxID=3038163 RepID=UPI0024151F84|nr:MCE family protein [Mycobacterium sp. 236(2023)]MDG4668181.1 MCE family protein [Mycobacterium sp. 236(2023)]
MIIRRVFRTIVVVACCLAPGSVGCAFQGVNSLPLPGTVGRGDGAQSFHAKLANIGSLEPNSPVMIDDVVVGSIKTLTASDWTADVQFTVKPGVAVPSNALAAVGQTSLLGSMHLSLNPPVGEQPVGRLRPGSTVPLDDTFTYPSTEETLASVSVLVNSGGLGQIGDIVRNMNAALGGREQEVRELLGRLDRLVGVFDSQKENVVASIQTMNRLAETVARQRDAVSDALRDLPPALDVLIAQRPRITEALNRLGDFSDTTTTVVNEAEGDLIATLQNLGPTVRALADVGPEIGSAIAHTTVSPFSQNIIDRGVHGDYMNLFITIDLTVNRLKRTLLSGTRWANPYVPLVPAPGDSGYDAYYAHDPLTVPLAIPPAETVAPQAEQPAVTEPTAGEG